MSAENDQYHFVSVCNVVKALLQNEILLNRGIPVHPNHNKMMAICMTTVMVLISENIHYLVCVRRLLRVHLHTDEFEIANPSQPTGESIR